MSTLPEPGVAARQARPSSLQLPSQASAAKIALAYAAAGAVWILGSGWLLDRLVDDQAIQAALELMKGWFFVGATALLLWLVLDRYFRMIRRSGRLLEDSEARWKQALEGASQAVWDWDIQGGEVLYSPEWKALLGYEPHEIGNSLAEWESRVHPEDRPRVMGELQGHLEGQSLLYLAEHRVRCKDGDYRWILSRGKVARRSPDGQPLRLVGTCSDIHRRKQAEEWNHIKHDLLQALAAATRLEDGLRLCLDAALKAEGIDSGGFYLVEEPTGALSLAAQRGFAPPFVDAVSRIEAGTPQAQCVAEGQPVFATWKASPPVLSEAERREGLRAVARIPVCFEGCPIGCLHVASHSRNEIPLVAREALETIAAGAAQAIVRLHAQEALRASEEKHRGIFDESVVAIYVFDQDKRFLDSNQAGQQLLGYSLEELRQLRMPDVDADPAVVLPAHQKLLTGGRLINYEHRLRRKDGSVITVLNNSRPLTDAGGHVVGLQSTLVDITEYRHAQVALENSERLLRMALDVGKIGVFEVDVATGQATRSSGAEEIWGLPAEFQGDFLQYCWDHIHPADVERVRGSYTQFLEQTGEQETDFRVVRPDGTVCWLRWRGRVLADAAGVARRVIGVHVDINERKRLEQDRETALLKYRTLFDSLPLGVTLADQDGRLVESNRAAKQLLRLPVEELQHRTIDGPEWRIVRPDGSPMPPVDYASVRALREQRLIENVEMGLVRSPTETTWISATAAPVALPGTALVITYSDITARKQAEQLLQERETRFRALIENAPDGVVLVSREDRMTYASPAACRMFGVDGARLHEIAPDEGTHPEDLPRVLAALDQLLHDPAEVKTLQYRFRHADGNWIWIESTFTNLLDVPGVNAIVINFRNIHDRKLAEDALQERDALLREMGRVAKVGGWEFDAASGVGRWTEEVARIHDLPLDTQPTKTLGLSFYPGEAGERIRAAVTRAVSQGIPYDLELEFLSAQGVRKWVHTIGQPVWQEDRIVKLRGAIQDITERKQAEAELAFEATRRRILIEGSRDGIVVLDQAGKVLEANRRFAEMLGYTAEEVQQLHVWDWDRDWPPERVLEAIRLLGPEGSHFETRHYRKDGSTFSVDLSNSAAELAGQKLVFCVCHDITERKRSEAALQESLLFRREAENIARIGAWKVNPETDYVYWTEGVREIIEVPQDYAPGLREGLQFYDAEAIPALQQALQAALKDGTPFRIETGVTTTSGRRRWTEVRGLKRVEDGGQAFVMGTFQDITERKRAELDLRASEERYRSVLDAMTDSIHVVERDQRLVLVNETCRQWCVKAGVEEPRPGQALRQALPFLPADAEHAHGQALATGAPVTSLRNKVKLDGHELDVDIRHIPIREHGRPHRIMTVIRDVTEHAKLESQLLRAQRMESLGTMAAGIAHDLNNVLTPVMISVPLIREQIRDGETRNLLDSVETSVQRGADIIRQLLVFSRGVEGERRPLRLGDQVKELLKITREVFPRNLIIRNEIPRELWPVSSNSTHLHQVLLNLSVNARDAMPHGGTLTFCGQNLILDESYGGLSPAPKPGPYVLLQVRDTGVGIPAGLLDKIFDPFFTTKGVGEGTGLGLSTVQGIVVSHGGFVEVDSQEGRGTEFRVFLPAIQTGEVPPNTPPAEVLEQGNGQTILVVDDEPAVRSLLQKTLERFGYRVLCARDGNEALAVHEAHQAQIAAVLSDLAMPGMNGLALALRLQQINPRLPVLVTTGRADKDQRSALTAAGVKHLLDKPFRAAALLTALRDSLTQSHDNAPTAR